MKKILLVLLVNMLIIALIYSTYVKSRKTVDSLPEGVNIVSGESVTPEDKVLYGSEYSKEDIKIYLEEDMDGEYIREAEEVLSMFPANVIRSISENGMKIILYTDKRNAGDEEGTINVCVRKEEELRDNLTFKLCEYTDRIYGISSLPEYSELTDEIFTDVMSEYVKDKQRIYDNNPLLYEYLEDMFNSGESIEEIINS